MNYQLKIDKIGEQILDRKTKNLIRTPLKMVISETDVSYWKALLATRAIYDYSIIPIDDVEKEDKFQKDINKILEEKETDKVPKRPKK